MIVTIVGPILSYHAEAIAAASRAAPHDVLQVVIDSEGGSLAAAFAVCDAIDSHPGMTKGRVVNRADSAARLVVAACRIRTARPSARFLFHGAAAVALPGRPTAGVLRAHAARIEDVDRIARARLASYIGCTVEEIISLEARGATISGCEALELGLVNRLVGAPILSQRAADARVERLIAGTRPARFTAADVARMAAAGINGRPIGIAKPALRDLLNDRARR